MTVTTYKGVLKIYKNLSGHSGIKAYDIGDDFIIVAFITGDIYRYDNSMPGKEHVENMKYLAQEGFGLSTYLSKAVKGKYARKL
ncbi:MAG: hypothetical protein AAGA02_03575 [Bacteroidota bacterium]